MSREESLVESSFEERTETSILVQEAFKHLSPKDAACVQLHYGDGFTYEQIGQIVNISAEAVRKRVSRGVEKFRKVYAQENPLVRSTASIKPSSALNKQ